MKKSHKSPKICALISADTLPAEYFGSATNKHVYLAYAGYSNQDHDFKAWPSRQTMAIKTGYSMSTIARANRCLEKRGLVKRETRVKAKMYTSSITTLCIDTLNKLVSAWKKLKTMAKASFSGCVTVNQPLCHSDTKNIQREHQKPYYASRNQKNGVDRPQKPRSTRDMTIEECLFDTSWAQ